MLNRGSRKLATLVVSALICLSGGAAMAGDPMAGADIVKRWCVACHATGNNTAAPDIGPSFVEIANDPFRTDSRLRAWLVDPHPPMPNPGLSRIEIENVIAYLATLRTN